MVIKTIGILIIILGSACLLNPTFIINQVTYFKQGKRIYLGAALNILIGALLLMNASQSKLMAVVVVLGILSLLKGISIFVVGTEKVKKLMDCVEGKPVSVLRMMAALTLVVGALLIYAA